MIANYSTRRLLIEPKAATAIEYGLIGGVLAVLFGLLFLRVGPHLAEAIAGVALRLGIKPAG